MLIFSLKAKILYIFQILSKERSEGQGIMRHQICGGFEPN